MNHLKWCLAAVGYVCVPWMELAARDLYGTLDIETGLQVYNRAYLSMAKKNAKSSWCGWAHLYHLEHQHRPGNRALSIATTRKQATEVFDGAAVLINGNPDLRARFKVSASVKVILHKYYQTRYDVLSGDGDENDGCQSSQWIRDELHRFKTDRALALLEAVERSARGKPESLGIDITTAGDPTESKPWLEEYSYAKRVKSGLVKNPRYYVQIHEADPEKLKADPEHWKSKEARLAGNPSHVENGGFIKDEELLDDLQKAIESPSKQRGYWRFTINAMAESDGKLFNAADWKACDAKQGALIGRRCFAGVDLSSTTDLTAKVLVFPAEDGFFDVLAFFWVPKDRVAAIAKQLGPHGPDFRRWVKEGLIQTTDGNQVDYAAVEKQIDEAYGDFDVQEIDFDKWNATDLRHRLQAKNYTCVEIPQGIALSPAIKELQKLVLARKIRHGGNEVLAFMAGCAKAHQDPNENMRLVKAVRNLEAARVDGIAALLNALSRAMVAEDTKSVYEDRGLLSV